MKKRLPDLAACLLLLVAARSLPAQELSPPGVAFAMPSHGSGALAFFADICQFEGRAGTTALEISYAVDLSQFSSHSSPSQPLVLDLDLLLRSAQGEVLVAAHEKKSIALAREQEGGAFSFLDLKRYEVAPGPVTLQMALRDSVSGREGSLRREFVVRDLGRGFSLSDLMLSAQLQKARGKSVFEKGGLVVVPLPSRSFSLADSLSQLFVYFEINHLQYAPAETSFYGIHYAVHDAQGKRVFTNTRAQLPKAGANSSRIEKIPVAGLPPGHYRLSLQVIDLTTQQACSASVDFACTPGPETVARVLTMTPEDMQKYFDQIKYVASEREREIYWQLSNDGKQNFLLEFWKAKDPTPGTPENEFMLEHFRRLAYCREKFSGGLNSDMARIYIKYGSPMEVSREAFDAKINRPVEIWTYALDGRREFVFVDRTGDGHYVLVHSNHPAEYSNPNWMEDYAN
ncbi:MAG: hypothetical protein DKINENOH_00866 [bacterium]|nr:hypothetical protein [bacterium]